MGGCLLNPDIFAIGHFVEVIEWPLLGSEIWNFYLEYCKETNDDTPCIIIEKNKTHSFPSLEMPKVKKWLYIDSIDRDSTMQMIAFIKKIKSNLKEKIL